MAAGRTVARSQQEDRAVSPTSSQATTAVVRRADTTCGSPIASRLERPRAFNQKRLTQGNFGRILGETVLRDCNAPAMLSTTLRIAENLSKRAGLRRSVQQKPGEENGETAPSAKV